MGILNTIRELFAPKSYAEAEFRMGDLEFFVALLRACPEASRLTFDQSEPESFVHSFRRWSYRARPDAFEADYYTIDADFISLAERLAAQGPLDLDCHFGISSPDGRLLCASWDDFTVVKLDDAIRDKIRSHLR